MDENNRITITVCGDGGCGKSSITLRLVRSQWTHEYDPTIEDSYSVTRTIDGQSYFLMLTDTAGQEEYRGLWAASNLKSDAFLLVYDITNVNSLDALEYFADMIAIEEDTRIDSGQTPPVKIVAGNKCDLQGARQIKSPQGLEWARKRGCGFMETSAREMVNIEETFALLVRRVVEARRVAANGGVADNPTRTAALPPVNEKDGASSNQVPEKNKVQREALWKRLRCW
ncbi:ras-domain-containing protein [Lophiostoma macrostomum CBS 122681]|uniref:Ras-domain-containing protein n=1 Tax=Lophiostoma macrostomum CBS 122681 TaxID=1314788 RepID=A0A6A6TED9_9PLEO|nr:ras-domain-containing protein [Lophiostoma macrostomum CBS 122681]